MNEPGRGGAQKKAIPTAFVNVEKSRLTPRLRPPAQTRQIES